MRHHIKKFLQEITKDVSIALTIALIVSVILYTANIIPIFWQSKIVYLFIITLVFGFFYFLLKIKSYPVDERPKLKLTKIMSYIFLVILIIIALNQVLVQLVKFKIPIISSLNLELTLLAIATGILTFFANSKKVEKEMQGEKKKAGKWYYIGLITITVIFIAIKILMPIVYTGSYVDEYTHILSGIEFFKSGHFAEIYHGEYYNRGAYVSFLVGLFFLIFGKTIFVAKMVPAFIGIINFVLLFFIAKKIIKKKPYILLLLLIYTFSPWVVFNHFYIRMYVFCEFFILFLTLIFMLIIRNIQNVKKTLVYSLIGIFTLIIIQFFSYGEERYPVLIYSLFFISYLFFFKLQQIPIRNRLYRSFSENQLLKIIIFILVFIFLFFWLDCFSLVKNFTSGTVMFTTPKDYKYDNLFFNLNTIFTILFLCSFSFLFFKKINICIKLIIFSSLFLFLLHFASSLDFQMARTIIYFLPLFYLVSILIFSGVSKITKSKILVGLILIILVLNIYVNYPGGFFYEGPILPKEVTLVDYEKAFNYVQEFTNKSIIVSDSAGYSGLFHTNNEIYLLGEFKNRNFEMLLERDKIFLENTTNMYLFSLNIPIITDPKKEREFIENKCVVVRQGYFLLNPSTIKEIEQTHNNKIFKNIIVYIPRNISKVNG